MQRLVAPGIEQLRPYEAGKPVEELARERGVIDAVKLASNENPLGPSPRALAAISGALDGLHRYPDAAAHALRERLASHLGVQPNELVLGNGSNEVLELAVRTFCTSEHHIVFAEPAFVVYRMVALASGVPFTAVPLRALTHDLSAMAAAVRPETRVMFVANPNNPTGTHVGRDALVQLLDRLPPEVVVVLDEAYIEYADAPDFPDGLTLRDHRERLIVTRTFSKIYGLAALRLGYGVAPRGIVDYMNRVRAPFNVNAVAQRAGIAALDDAEHVERSRTLNLTERARVGRELSALGLAVASSQANFLYVDVGRPGRDVYEALLDVGVIVRAFGPSAPGVRITVGIPAENDRMLEAMKGVFA